MRRLLAILGLFGGLVQAAEAPPEPPVPAALSFISEHAVEGMRGGNLSGLAWCGGALWTVSDRDDDRLYRLQPSAEGSDQPWQAEAESFIAPTPPDSGLPWGMSTRVWLSGLVRGGNLDFEGIACDAAGNRYLVSEAHAAVLQLPVSGKPNWLRLPPGLLPQARASGMLMNFNALFEGIAVDPEGKRLWLAAERERRGLLVAHRDNSAWRCEGSCVLLAEGGKIEPPPELGSARKLPKDFSDLAFYRGKLFTLERLAHQICRRDLAQAKVERCWSFASAVLAPERRYELPYGVAEALSLDDKGALAGHRQWRPCARRWRRAALRPALRRARRRLVGGQVTQRAPGQRLGRIMLVLAWIAGLALATRYFGVWEDRQRNPNQAPQSIHGDGYVELRLASSRQGHYLLNGQINGQGVTFLLDTGATQVAVPEALAARLALERGAPITLSTANGRATGWRTRLDQLQLGDIRLSGVAALIAPGMDGDEVLLGMSALKQLEFTQRDGTLVLRQNTSP